MTVTVSPCSFPSLVSESFRGHLLTSLQIHSCWHFGNWIIAQAAVAVFVVSRSWLSSTCSAAGGGVCGRTVSPLTILRVTGALTQNQLSLPFSSQEVPTTLAAGRGVGGKGKRCDFMTEGSRVMV